MKALSHVITVVALLAVFIGIPFLSSVDVAALASGTDVISSATVIQEAPSGKFVILINTDKHVDPEVLDRWCAFFNGEATELIMEDVSCLALSGDVAGIEMATSLQSRLAENQMQLRVEQSLLVISKAEVGDFDVIVMSQEFADSLDAASVYELPNVVVIWR